MPPTKPETSVRPADSRSDFGRFSPTALAAYYRREFGTSLAVNLAYRGAVAIWTFSIIIEPLVFIVVWRTVAGSAVPAATPARSSWATTWS